jgi:hypothetical protein
MKYFSPFNNLQISFLCSQKSATGLDPESDERSPNLHSACPNIINFRIIIIIIIIIII